MSKRSVVLVTSVLVAISSVAVLSVPSGAQAVARSRLVQLRNNASPPVPPRSQALGPLSSTAELHIEVTLKLPDPSAVTSFIASLSDRRSPNFHHFLQAGQFGPTFGPSLSEVSAVDSLLISNGLHPGQVSPNHLSIPLTAPVSAIDRAFHVNLVRYRLPSGRVAYTSVSSPSISTAVAPDIEGIVGLSDLIEPQSLLVRKQAGDLGRQTGLPRRASTAGPAPCAAASAVAISDGSLTADQLASYYGFDPLYSLGDYGQGVNVALVEFETEPTADSDISAYQSCYGTDATVNYRAVDGGASSNSGDPSGMETALDIEDVIGLAPRATIDVYQAPNGNVLDLYTKIVDSDRDQVVSSSWGECELDNDPALLASEQTLFEQAATQGQTVLAAAGDSGSTDCYGDPGTSHGATPSVDDPASQPNVIGVGGTTLTGASEEVWNDSQDTEGAGGGGVSETWCMPAYQDQSGASGIINANSVQSPSCAASLPYLREVPDVAADADPNSGYVIDDAGSWMPIGGTSGAAPLWAAAAALIDSSPFCADYGSGDAGARPEGLYALAGKGSPYYGLAFNDITSGTNDYTPSSYTSGLYPATTGYDMASGLGSPKLAYPGNFYPGLAAQMCDRYATKLTTTSITAVTPDEGPASSSTSVTISGSGFLPIVGADELEVGTTSVEVSCTTTTSCTATLPPAKPGTDNLVMSVEDLALSPVAASDRFTFLAPAPTVTIGSPANGQYFSVGQNVGTSFSCSEGANGPGIATCLDSHGSPSPGLLDTSSKGTFSYSVTAVSKDGLRASASITYTVGASTTTLRLSASKLTYGHEQTERLSVTVSPKHVSTPATGKVTVGESGTSLCVITLSSGRGSCPLSPKRLNAGSYHLTASYGGSSALMPSSSARELLTVAKATTKIALKLSAARVTYGHEQTERLSVTVYPQYPGSMPTGTVGVTSPKTRLCRIVLRSGKGSCRLSGKNLKAGTYRLLATYAGSTNFIVASSAKQTLVASS